MPDKEIFEPGSDSAVFLKDVSVHYRIPNESINTFKEYIIRAVQGRIQYNKFTALDNISIHVKKGEILGVIGRNGAGKSTLLKVVSRVLIPEEGRVWLNGKISPLLQLGAGFHPELTGRENIFLNATLLGHKREEVESKIDSIVEFSEIGNFIEAPIRTYSSGMRARLGFSVATAWKPDILLLDEILSVGDISFQEKCLARMNGYRESGSTIILVSHSIDRVRRICKNAIWLNRGKIKVQGSAEKVCAAYEKVMVGRR